MSEKQSNPSVPKDKGNICTISTKEKIGLTCQVHQMKKGQGFYQMPLVNYLFNLLQVWWQPFALVTVNVASTLQNSSKKRPSKPVIQCFSIFSFSLRPQSFWHQRKHYDIRIVYVIQSLKLIFGSLARNVKLKIRQIRG